MKSKIYLCLSALFFSVSLVFGQWTQLGADIDGEAFNDRSGQSVSLSSDGTILAVGAPLSSDNGPNSGHVRVFELNGANWVQLGQDIEGESFGDVSGHSVSLNSDGSRIAIGGYYNNAGSVSDVGHVRVYEFNGVNWVQLGQDIDGETDFDRFGWSVSLNAAGNRVAAGADWNDGGGLASGHVRVFEFDGANWVQIGQDIDGEAADDRSGHSVSLSSNGGIVAIGAYNNDDNGNNAGHVRIFEFNGANWIQLGTDIDAEAAANSYGYSVSLSSNGSIVAIGGIFNSNANGAFSGHVRVLEFDGADWVQLGQDIDGEAAGDRSGCAVSLNSNGDIVAIGAYDNTNANGNDSGHVRIYQYNGMIWEQAGTDIDGESFNDNSGWSVSLSDSGATVAIGAPWNDDNGNDAGHVRVYSNPTLLYTDIPDLNFEQSLIDQGIDSEAILDGRVLTPDISDIVFLDVSNENIANLSGIESFSTLNTLNCAMNQLGSLDLSNNLNLTSLTCNNNQLTSLIISNGIILLDCSNNQLIGLDVTDNLNLQSLSCNDNQLITLNLKGLLSLTDVDATNNPLSCVEVNNRFRAISGTGIYANWLVDNSSVYAFSCNLVLVAAKPSEVKLTPDDETIVPLSTVKLYPNPVRDFLYIALPEGKTVMRAAVYTLHGKKLLETFSDIIDVGSLDEGMYFVEIQTSGEEDTLYKKIVVSGR